MSTVIFKYELMVVPGANHLTIPRGARFLTAQFQDGRLMLWAEVDAQELLRDQTVRVVATGQPLDVVRGKQYLATVQEGTFVWHVFVPHGAP